MYEITNVQCGDNFQLFLTNNCELYSCGSNRYGQLGTEDDSEMSSDDVDDSDKEESFSKDKQTSSGSEIMKPKVKKHI